MREALPAQMQSKVRAKVQGKIEEKESKGKNERIMDGTSERRPTKKKANFDKTAHCSP